ncbi:MAG: hypothetical protein L0922_05585 [Candidatus Mariimomonas ferrooxydans]
MTEKKVSFIEQQRKRIKKVAKEYVRVDVRKGRLKDDWRTPWYIVLYELAMIASGLAVGIVAL